MCISHTQFLQPHIPSIRRPQLKTRTTKHIRWLSQQPTRIRSLSPSRSDQAQTAYPPPPPHYHPHYQSPQAAPYRKYLQARWPNAIAELHLPNTAKNVCKPLAVPFRTRARAPATPGSMPPRHYTRLPTVSAPAYGVVGTVIPESNVNCTVMHCAVLDEMKRHARPDIYIGRARTC